MWNSLHTLSSIILYLTVEKDDQGKTQVTGFRFVPTWVHRRRTQSGTKYRVLPIRQFLKNPDNNLSADDLRTMRSVLASTTRHLGIGK
jgi:poly-gamma-glutamate synthesis protein (capsule biosynthesis protein)